MLEAVSSFLTIIFSCHLLLFSKVIFMSPDIFCLICCRYCDCFAAGLYCVEPCACENCFNKPIHEDVVMKTRQDIEARNPLAFAPKVVSTSDYATGFGVRHEINNEFLLKYVTKKKTTD